MDLQKKLFILIFLITFFPARGSAEYLYGEVAEVNRERQEFVLVSVTPGRGEGEATLNETRVTVKAMGSILPQSEEGKALLPGCVQVGEMVRVWGESMTAEADFLASDVRGCRGKGCSDPTGVRSRLHGDKRRNFLNQGTGNTSVNASSFDDMDDGGVDGGGRGGRGGTGGSGRSGGGGGGGRGR